MLFSGKITPPGQKSQQISTVLHQHVMNAGQVEIRVTAGGWVALPYIGFQEPLTIGIFLSSNQSFKVSGFYLDVQLGISCEKVCHNCQKNRCYTHRNSSQKNDSLSEDLCVYGAIGIKLRSQQRRRIKRSLLSIQNGRYSVASASSKKTGSYIVSAVTKCSWRLGEFQ